MVKNWEPETTRRKVRLAGVKCILIPVKMRSEFFSSLGSYQEYTHRWMLIGSYLTSCITLLYKESSGQLLALESNTAEPHLSKWN